MGLEESMLTKEICMYEANTWMFEDCFKIEKAEFV